jgi:hypothetical protein
MAKQPKTNTSRKVVARSNTGDKKQRIPPPKAAVFLLLSIAIVLVVVLFPQQSDDDVYFDKSIWSEVYMPEKFGVGVIAKRNISVSFLPPIS